MHLHKWTKWNKPYSMRVVGPGLYPRTDTHWYQKRECEKCGKVKVKNLNPRGLQ